MIREKNAGNNTQPPPKRVQLRHIHIQQVENVQLEIPFVCYPETRYQI